MPNETTRLERAKEFIYEERSLISTFPATALVNFATQECAALEKENAALRTQVNEWREASKTAVEITHIMEDGRRKIDDQIESLTVALAEAREAMLHAHGFIRARRQDIHDEGCGCCDCVMLTELKAAIEAAGGVK